MTEQRKPGAEDLIPRQGHSFTIKSRTPTTATAANANAIPSGSSSSSNDSKEEVVVAAADTVIIAKSPFNPKSNAAAGDINTDEYVGGELLNYHDMSIGKHCVFFFRVLSFDDNICQNFLFLFTFIYTINLIYTAYYFYMYICTCD